IQDEDTSPSEITQEVSGRVEGLEEIQDEDTSPSEITSKIPMEVEGFEPPQEVVILVRRSERTHRAPDRLCLNVEAEEHILVNLPPGCKTVRSKWIFKKKTDMDADIRAIRILISIAAYYDYEIWQMDVKTTFLNGYLDEDIYMVQPEGFVNPNHPRKVCKLQRSIYGLKKASRSWNKRFDEEIKSLQSVKDYLGKCFAMKDLGEAAFILGIKIYRDRSKRLIGLSQNAYMDKILKRYKMDNSKRGTIPMQERLDLNKSQGAQTPKEVNRESHWTAVKNILKYLRNTKDMFLVYSGNPKAELRVDCYCNTGFEIDIDDMKSLT
ncbi:retrotransposon protein, putative, ty1-copia subclass, partial [Tanacetum coccineum]